VRDEEAGGEAAASVKVSARVRDIITRNLASPDEAWPPAAANMPGVEQMTEENRVLQVCGVCCT